ncbi:hypothetical protein [Butyrivibrio fibrisolvens]|uniref:hypothetical protein n=1 Tax=Butyrivibrio fibrisolvens TaxID=831 RepID=UPI0003B30D15|nr:hypothetical protein [Butyrivibrio fibrisolvens]
MTLQDFSHNLDIYIADAIEIGQQATSGRIKLKTDICDITNLDSVIAYIHGLYTKELIDDATCWSIAVPLGVLFGEMIIKEHQYHWSIDSNNIPVVETPDHNNLSPITKLYKIILDTENIEGSASSFYEAFKLLQYTARKIEESKYEKS